MRFEMTLGIQGFPPEPSSRDSPLERGQSNVYRESLDQNLVTLEVAPSCNPLQITKEPYFRARAVLKSQQAR